MGKEIDEKTLKEAKEKLACKIEPATFLDANGAGGPSHAAETAASPQPAQTDFIGPDGKVFLTRMTTAGG